MPISSLLFDKEERGYKGVRLATGQDIFSHRLLMDPSSVVPPFLSPDSKSVVEIGQGSSMASKVARLVCITRSSLHPELSNILIVFPPKSLFPGQKASVRALQLGSSVAVCPPGFFVVYISVKCNDAIQGKEHVLSAMNSLFKFPGEDDDAKGGTDSQCEYSETSNNESTDEPKPILLWRALYVQELTQVTVGSISSPPMPDGNLDYKCLLESTEKLFHGMYPQEEFLPATLTPRDNDEDAISQD